MEYILDSPAAVLRTVVVGIPAYLALVAILRFSGKRTLSQMNAFDFIVTIALGSTLATILVSPQTSLAQGVVALLVLVGLQYVITWTSFRWKSVARLAKSEPAALVYRGQMLPDAMRRERVLATEIEVAVRQSGLGRVADADLVVLETDGTLSVLANLEHAGDAISAVTGVPDQQQQSARGREERHD